MKKSGSVSLFKVGVLGAVAACCGFICERTDTKNSPVIAQVGRAILTLDDLNRSIPAEYSDQITSKQRVNYVRQWIDTELLFQEALRRGIHKEKEIRKRLDQMKKDLLSAELINRHSSGLSKKTITEEAIQEYYEKYKETFIRESDAVKYAEIIVDDLETGWKVRNLMTPSNFSDLAKEYSLVPVPDPAAAAFVPLKNLPPEIAEAAFSTRLEGTTSPIELPDGVHIIRIIDKQKAGDFCLLEEVREEIISTLSAQSQKKDIENLLAELQQKSTYTFNLDMISRGEQSRGTSGAPAPETPQPGAETPLQESTE
jgi:parvulin-like peptidyl-prolyl isomerase